MIYLIALFTNTVLGTFNTNAQCESAIKQLYVQRIDPYHSIPKSTMDQVIELNMKYDAPKRYACVKNR